jgi:hypothetical protein
MEEDAILGITRIQWSGSISLGNLYLQGCATQTKGCTCGSTRKVAESEQGWNN